MGPFGELHASLLDMGFRQLVLAFVLLGCYACALSGMLPLRGRLWALALGLTAATAFTVQTRPWEYGVMLLAFGLVALGLFTLLLWSLDRLANPEKPKAEPGSASGPPAAVWRKRSGRLREIYELTSEDAAPENASQ